MADCVWVPAHEPWMCNVHPGGNRTSLDQTVCRVAQAESVQPMTPAEVEEFDRWAESRRGKGVSLGMLWALRLRATLDAARADTSDPEGLDVERLRAAIESALDVLGTMGNGEGWTIQHDVIDPLRAALPDTTGLTARNRQQHDEGIHTVPGAWPECPSCRAALSDTTGTPEPEVIEEEAGRLLVEAARIRAARRGPDDAHELRHLWAAINAGNSDPCGANGESCHLDADAIAAWTAQYPNVVGLSDTTGTPLDLGPTCRGSSPDGPCDDETCEAHGTTGTPEP